MALDTCPVFRPTLSDFECFPAYISKIESTLPDSIGIIKIIPPAGNLHFFISFKTSRRVVV